MSRWNHAVELIETERCPPIDFRPGPLQSLSFVSIEFFDCLFDLLSVLQYPRQHILQFRFLLLGTGKVTSDLKSKLGHAFGYTDMSAELMA